MRPEFIMPDNGTDDVTPRTVIACLSLIGGTKLTQEDVAHWTPMERVIVYDYAIREHLIASDNRVRRRPRPFFLGLCEAVKDIGADNLITSGSRGQAEDPRSFVTD